VDAHRKEDVEKKGQGERGIEKIEPNEEVHIYTFIYI